MVTMEKPHFFLTDCESVWSQIKHKEQQIQLKRRWLLGLSSSESERKKLKKENILETRSLPESLIREDDIFFDTVKSCVEEIFLTRHRSKTRHGVGSDDLELPSMHDIERVVLSHIDNLTTKGLSLLAKILIGSQNEYAKTQQKMKRIIRESLSVVFRSRSSGNGDNLREISRRITHFLYDPQNFRDNCVPFLTSRSMIQHASDKILEGLGNFPFQTLIAMYKKLGEVQQSLPHLQPKKSGFSRDFLIKRVKENSAKMLSGLGKEDDLPGPLAKAMAVASLSLKLTPEFRNSSVIEFHKFSPETKVLQNEIINAIWLVKTKVKMPVLKIVKILLDPNAKVSTRSLRTVIRKVLTEYLFWCNDMDTVPKSLLHILATINKNFQSRVLDISTLKNAIDEEIECILNVSAHMKQNLLDLLPANDFDVDFGHAYMEDLEESDDELDYEDNISQNSSWDEEVESTLDSVPLNLTRTCPDTRDERLKSVLVDGLEAEVSSRVDSTEFPEGKKTSYKNKYIAIQEVCDETSMTAYSLVGRLLKEFGHKEGQRFDRYCSLDRRKNCATEEDSQVAEQEWTSTEESDGMVMVRVTEELIPSFPKSGIERLRKLLGT